MYTVYTMTFKFRDKKSWYERVETELWENMTLYYFMLRVPAQFFF